MLEGKSVVEDVNIGDGTLGNWASEDGGSASNGSDGDGVLHDD